MKIILLQKWKMPSGIVKQKDTELIVHNDTGKILIRKKIAKKLSDKNKFPKIKNKFPKIKNK